MFRNSKLSNFKVRKNIWCFCVDANATQAAILLGLNRNTINNWFNVFRRMIYIHQEAIKEQIIGNVEAYFGATRQRGFHGKLKRGRGTLKQPVFGIFKRDGRVYTEIVPDCKKFTLQAVITKSRRF